MQSYCKAYIRFGNIPKNERSGVYQHGERHEGCLAGVSVYECIGPNRAIVLPSPIRESTVDTFYGWFAYGSWNRRPVYLVTGDRVGTGPDGEPLIRNVTILEELKDFWPECRENEEERPATK